MGAAILIQEHLRSIIIAAIGKAQTAGDLADITITEPTFSRPNLKAHGDWATNIALEMAAQAKSNPRSIAQAIASHIDREAGYVERIEVAGPGFINFFLSAEWLYRILVEIETRQDSFGRIRPAMPQTIQVEFVSANPVGPMHIGHGRWAALGDTLANILEWAGHKVAREFYVNDYGNQMALFGLSVAVRYAQELGVDEVMPENGYQGEYIRDIAKEIIAEHGRAFLDADTQERHRRLGDIAYRQVLTHLKATLEQIGVKFDVWFSERELHESGAVMAAVERLRDSGLVFEKDGAIWLRTTEFGDDKDRVLIRESGQPTYFAADVAYHRDKFDRGFDRVINIWGADHHGYIARVKAAVKALGIDPDRLEVIIGQLVNLLRNGEPVRMSKRTGEMVTLDELIDEVGKDAVRYLFLLRSADSAMDFDIEIAKKQSNDNPVFYIQYAHARICSILRFAEEQGTRLKSTDQVDLHLLDSEAELDLIRKITEFEEVIEHCAQNRSPHLLPKYAQELAGAFHVFYTKCRVVGEQTELSEARMVLIDCTRIVLNNLLTVCGVTAPEAM